MERGLRKIGGSASETPSSNLDSAENHSSQGALYHVLPRVDRGKAKPANRWGRALVMQTIVQYP